MPSDHRRLKLVGPTVSVSATHARKGSNSTSASCRKALPEASSQQQSHVHAFFHSKGRAGLIVDRN